MVVPGKEPLSLLIVDDEDHIRQLLAEALQLFGYMTDTAASTEEALEYLDAKPYSLLFCDLMMPGSDGFSLIEMAHEKFEHLPIIVLTGYATIGLAQRAIRLGAQDFITKPINVRELPFIIERNLERHRLEAQLNALLTEQLLFQTVQALVAAIEAKDPYTAGHSQNVSLLTMEFAAALQLQETDIFALRLAGLMHDVGKIGIPESILVKPEPLNDREWEVMRKHPAIGAEIVGRVQNLAYVAKIIRSHHERWDGQGYPDGLKGELIPFLSRILYLCDAYDALIADRSYRERMTEEKALQIIRSLAGTHFDVNLVQLLINRVLPNLKEGWQTSECYLPHLSFTRSNHRGDPVAQDK